MTMFKGKVTLDEAVDNVSLEEILLCGVKERRPDDGYGP